MANFGLYLPNLPFFFPNFPIFAIFIPPPFPQNLILFTRPISLSTCLSVCQSFYSQVCLSIHSSVCPLVTLSVSLSVHRSFCLSICYSVGLFVHLIVHLSVLWSVWLSVPLSVLYLYILPFVWWCFIMSINQSVHLFVCMSIWLRSVCLSAGQSVCLTYSLSVHL